MHAFWFGSPDCMNRNAMPLAVAHSVKSCGVDSEPLSKRIESVDLYQPIHGLSVLVGRRIEVPTSTPVLRGWPVNLKLDLKADFELTPSRGNWTAAKRPFLNAR